MILSAHAAERMTEYGIREDWVEAALAQPDWTTPDPLPGRTRYFKAIADRGNRVLRVVVEGQTVVTAHFDRAARRRRPSHV